MIDSLREALRQGGIAQERLAAVGVSAPGPVDIERGVVTHPPNLPHWRDVPLADRLRAEFGVPCLLENDANAAAVAEPRFGAGKGSRHMLFMTLSSGIGGGIIIDNRLYRGASGGAGEVGHIILNENGPACACGKSGCLEAYSSGTAIAREARQFAEAHPESMLARLAAENPPLSARTVRQAAEKGDDEAQRIIMEAGRRLGEGIGSLINIFNPEVIVLGGSLIKMGERYLGAMRESAAVNAFEQLWADVEIVTGRFPDEAPAIGAAVLAAESLSAG
jgi:glucokinase